MPVDLLDLADLVRALIAHCCKDLCLGGARHLCPHCRDTLGAVAQQAVCQIAHSKIHRAQQLMKIRIANLIIVPMQTIAELKATVERLQARIGEIETAKGATTARGAPASAAALVA